MAWRSRRRNTTVGKSRPATCWMRICSQKKLMAARTHLQRTAPAISRNPAMILIESVSTKLKKLRVGVATDKQEEVEGHLETARRAAGPCQADLQ